MRIAPGPPPLYDFPTIKKTPLAMRLQQMDRSIIRCSGCDAQTMRNVDMLCRFCRKHGTPADRKQDALNKQRRML